VRAFSCLHEPIPERLAGLLPDNNRPRFESWRINSADESETKMEQQNPTAGDSGASTPNPEDRIAAFLDAQDGGSSGESEQSGDPQNASDTDKPEKDAPAKDSEPQFTTAHLAAYLGVDEADIDVDTDGQPVFKTKVDGKEGSAKFSDLRKTYQLQAHAENRTREAAQREQAAERKLQEADQVIQQRHAQVEQSLQQVQQLAAIASDELGREYNAIPWAELKQADPGRAALLEVEFQKRAQRIQGVSQEINNRRAQAQAQAEQQREQAKQQSLVTEYRRLTDLIPEWKDSAVAEKERQELLTWIDKSGIDRDGLDLTKASQVALVRRAWKHDTLQASKPAIENKVRTAPKLVKPGQSQTQGEGSAQRVKALKQQIRTSKPGDSTKAFADFLLGTGMA
jgi:hypothetical protein